MIDLEEINRAVCEKFSTAIAAAGTGATLVAEDLDRPIQRPCGKVRLEDGSDSRMLQSGRERTLLFRLYYFAADRDRPKLENLAMRQALGDAFLDGFQAGDLWISPEEGLSFSVTEDGVLTAALDLTLYEGEPDAGEVDAEPMEELIMEMEGNL